MRVKNCLYLGVELFLDQMTQISKIYYSFGANHIPLLYCSCWRPYYCDQTNTIIGNFRYFNEQLIHFLCSQNGCHQLSFFCFRRTNILSGRGGGDRRNWITSRNSFGSQFKAKVSFLRIQADTFRKIALQKSQGKCNVTTLIWWGSNFCFFP